MPPRFTYWTIIAGGQPTAFRAATRDELLPTLKQLQSKQPDAAMMWFARGKLWPSEEAAAMALRMEREGGRRRGADWRPGGEHKDPRDRFKVPRDVKRERFAARLRRDRMEEQGGEPQRPRPTRPGADRPFVSRERPATPKEDRPFKPREDRPFRPQGDRPPGDRPFRPKGGPGGARPFRPKEGQPAGRPFRPKGPMGSGRGKPGGSFRGGGKKGGRGGGGRGQR